MVEAILKEISPEYSLEDDEDELQYLGHLIQRTDIGKDRDAGKDWRQEEKGTTEDEIVGWHHWLNGHEYGEVPLNQYILSSPGLKEPNFHSTLKTQIILTVYTALEASCMF